jgi:hypothetical protein
VRSCFWAPVSHWLPAGPVATNDARRIDASPCVPPATLPHPDGSWLSGDYLNCSDERGTRRPTSIAATVRTTNSTNMITPVPPQVIPGATAS